MATARLLPEEMLLRDRRRRRSRVAIIAAQEYSESLEGVLVSGLRFAVPVAIASDLTLVNGRLVFATASGHVVAEVLAEALPLTGFSKAGGDGWNRNRVRGE